MISSLLTYNKFRYHTHKIRLEKLVPLNYRFPTDNKKSSKKATKPFSNSTFGRNLGFQKSGICPRQPPGGFVFPEMTPIFFLLEMPENINNRHFLTTWLPLLCIYNVFFKIYFSVHEITTTPWSPRDFDEIRKKSRISRK